MKLSRIFYKALVSYMILPILIFILGWIKLVIAIPAAVALCFMAYRLLRDTSSVAFELPLSHKDIRTLVLASVVILVWAYLSGIGKLVFQNWDHIYRNAIFEMLVNNKWPIIKSFSFNGSDTPFLFVYYIGFWMPSAVIGKLFGITAGYYFQVFWSFAGVCLFYWLICCYLKRVSLLPLLLFVFFSGLDAVGTYFFTGTLVPLLSNSQIEWWAGLQFSSFTTQLFWVFNQAIPAWIFTIFLLLQNKNRYVIFILGSSLLFCPLPFIGLLPFVAYVLIRNAYQQREIKTIFLDIFSVENIIGGGISGLLTYVYFKANASGQHMTILGAVTAEGPKFLINIGAFLLFEVWIYALIIFRYQKKNPLLYVAVLFLCTCPLVEIGYGGDYCMRACIPAQVVLFLLVAQALYASRKSGDKITIIALSAVFLIGAITPLHEFDRTIQKTAESYKTGVPAYATALTEEELMVGNNVGSNFRGEALKSLFYKYLIK
jgi:hypothetical protein